MIDRKGAKMKKDKLVVMAAGDTYRVSYSLDVNDVIDTKVYDISRSGRVKELISCDMQDMSGVRVFNYGIAGRKPLTEILRQVMNKQQILTLLHNLLQGLETFGKNMISLSYIVKDEQCVFAAPDTFDVGYIAVPINKEMADLNEIRNFIKSIIMNARYSEEDTDNYVARLINIVNAMGTFSVSDMKNQIKNMLLDIGIDIESQQETRTETDEDIENVNGHILKTGTPKVSRLGVMRNKARMNRSPMGMPPMGMPPMGPPPMGPQGEPPMGMPPMEPQGQPLMGMPPMGPQGEPLMGMPPMGVPPMGSQGEPPMGMPPMRPQGQPPMGMPPMGPQGEPPMGMPPMRPQGQPPVEMPPMRPQPISGNPFSDAPAPYFVRTRNGEKINLDKAEFKIGHRGTDVDYVVSDNSAISRVHCIITKRNGVCFIKDNNSTNGTYVNGEELGKDDERFLTNNAVVILGDEEFVYHVR